MSSKVVRLGSGKTFSSSQVGRKQNQEAGPGMNFEHLEMNSYKTIGIVLKLGMALGWEVGGDP